MEDTKEGRVVEEREKNEVKKVEEVKSRPVG
jgi:hypothetical protein